MAKSLLLNVLVDVLGNYVEGLSRENLKVGVWNGTIELYNMRLKNTALDDLNLPIKVQRGCIKKIHVKIPWASLESKPVTVIIDGIFLQAGPLDLSTLSAEDSQRMISMSIMKKLEEAEKGILAMVQKKDDLQTTAKQATYVQQLTAKIIDNLEVTVTKLHIRYEDSTSIPGTVFSCGVTIDSLSLATTDEQGFVGFVNREIDKRKETAIHKLGTMENFAVYWNSTDSALGELAFKDWEGHMLARVSASATTAQAAPTKYNASDVVVENYAAESSFLVAPPNKFTMKIAHKEQCTEVKPKLDVVLGGSTIGLVVSAHQFHQLKVVSQVFTDLDRRKLLITHRPKKRPTESPREWWLYAYRLISGKAIHNGGDQVLYSVTVFIYLYDLHTYPSSPSGGRPLCLSFSFFFFLLFFSLIIFLFSLRCCTIASCLRSSMFLSVAKSLFTKK
jgi:vacuolar protein sorting-associated protein 13A/C